MIGHTLTVASSSPPAQYERTHEGKRTAFYGNWGLFAGVFFACVTSVTIATLLVPKQYTATVKLLVSVQTAAGAGHGDSPNYDTIVDLVHEGSVVRKVIDTLKLDASAAQLRGRIRVKPLPNTPIFGLSATSSDPAQAAAVANTFAGALIDRDRELAGARALAAQAYLRTAISKAESTLRQANGALSVYQARNAAESKLEGLKDDREQSQARLSSALAQMAALTPTIAGQQITDLNPATTELRKQLAETETQLALARRRYTDQNPALVSLEQQREVLLRRLAREPVTVAGQTIAIPNPVYQQLSEQAATLRSHIEQDVVQIAELQRRDQVLVPAVATIAEHTTQLEILQERSNLAADLYKSLEQKYDDAAVAANSATSDVAVVQPAEPDDVTVSPNLLFNVVAGVVIGLAAALIAVAIANSTRRRLRKNGDAAPLLGLPTRPNVASLTKQQRFALPWLHTATLITSPEKGDRTTTAYYMASAMSQVLTRVLLIDADMRYPTTHLHARIENRAGLSEILSGQRSFDQVVVHCSATLDVLTAGAARSTPLALADTAALDELLDLARERYDCVIIDTPALGPVIYSAAPIATQANSTALVRESP